MLKLYQTRHPDINASAYSAYASFAVVICLAVLGVVWLPLTYGQRTGESSRAG